MSAEGLSPSASLEQPASPEGIVIHAIVPDRSGSHILTVDGRIPSELHLPGQGTYEDTLVRIGRDSVGGYVSPDLRLPNRGGIVYLTKPVEDGMELPEGYLWQRLPKKFEPELATRERLAAYGAVLLQAELNPRQFSTFSSRLHSNIAKIPRVVTQWSAVTAGIFTEIGTAFIPEPWYDASIIPITIGGAVMYWGMREFNKDTNAIATVSNL